jgi:hypothetical protein
MTTICEQDEARKMVRRVAPVPCSPRGLAARAIEFLRGASSFCAER